MSDRPPAREPASRRAYVAVGSNIDPAENIRVALRRLRERFGELTVSPVYRNRAEGFEGDDFLNLVVGFDTREEPTEIVAELERLHREAGRVRGAEAFSSRTLDLDLLLCGDEVVEALKIPRPDITRYAFVLRPLADIAPELRHPVTGKTMAQLWRDFDQPSHPLERVANDLAG